MLTSTHTRDAKLIDVAKAAGCSPATVSRVLNNNPNVGEDVRQRVMQAATAVGYEPTSSSRISKLRLAGVVIPTLSHAIYATMIDGLEARLAEKDVGLIISTSRYDVDLELEQVRQLLERGASSIILVGALHRPQTIELLERRHIPYVFTYACESRGNAAAIGFDNRKAGRMGARFLFDLGHRKVSMIAGLTQDNDRAAERVEGFIAESLAFGLERKNVDVVEAPYQLSAGYSAMAKLMSNEEPPTAVFCGSDILAVGALKYCNQNGIAVPSQVSILGFDNLEIAQISTPELSTLEVPAKEMGRLAGDYVLASPAQRRHLHQHELSVSLVVRGTTAPLS